jgi:hypothetical protein
MLTKVSAGVLNVDDLYGFRNRIINGDMRIAQRGTAAVTVNSDFPVDRFIAGNTSDGTFTAQQDASAPAGFTSSIKFTTTTADATLTTTQNFTVRHRIEGFNVSDLGWGTAGAQPVTLSFWVRSSLTGTFGGGLRNSASNRSYPFTYTISVADTWEYKTVTIPGDSSGTWVTDNGIGIRLDFALGAGPDVSGPAGAWNSSNHLSVTGAVSVIGSNGATFQITGVQLEKGTVATPFERRPYGMELALCQRYYETIRYEGSALFGHYSPNGGTSDGPSFTVSVPFKVAKRASPTVPVVASDNNVNSYWMIQSNSAQSGTGVVNFTPRNVSVDGFSAWCPRLSGGGTPFGAGLYVWTGGVTFNASSEL